MNSYGKDLYEGLIKVTKESPEKFFANYQVYRGKNIVIFDYSIVIPNNFTTSYHLEARGSAFIVDDDGNYIGTLCLPFEKFFNLHEFDYDNPSLDEVVRERYGFNPTSETIKSLDGGVWMDKRDGSIISMFELLGDIDAKSNSSLTSEYKYEALDIIKNDNELYSKTKELTEKGYTVIFEYTSSNASRQIVLKYNTTSLIVIGVRHNSDGTYLSYDDIVEHFGEKYVVDIVDGDFEDVSKKDIEGYVVCFPKYNNFRVKFKMEEYLREHKIKSTLGVPSTIWKCYIEKEIDDMLSVTTNKNTIESINSLLKRCDDLYSDIITRSNKIFEMFYNDDRKEFFKAISEFKPKDAIDEVALNHTKNMYLKSLEQSLDELHQNLVTKKAISKLGVTKW